MFFVGQHGQRGRAALLVGARDRGGIEVLGQHALAGRGLLDFGDDGGLAAGESAAGNRGGLRDGLLGARVRSPSTRWASSSFFCSTIWARMSGIALTMGGNLYCSPRVGRASLWPQSDLQPGSTR